MAEKRNNIRVLHCMYAEKFIQPYIDFISDNFNLKNHYFLIRKNNNYPIRKSKNIYFVKNGESKLARIFLHMKYFSSSEKIILHGILSKELWFTLLIQPWVLKKCYWVIWGGDLYSSIGKSKYIKSYIYENVKKLVISRIGFLLTFIYGDYLLAKSKYSASGKYLECLMYQSNTLDKLTVLKKVQPGKRTKISVKILAGNSAHTTNNHLELFQKLLPFKEKDILIYCPLSYGPRNYALEIAKAGKDLFGDKFIPLLTFMPLEDYLTLISSIDIAVYNHRRQQALGQTIALLQRGKKVYMRSDVSQWDFFNDMNIKIFDLNNINLYPISISEQKKNIRQIKNNLTERHLLDQWKSIFCG